MSKRFESFENFIRREITIQELPPYFKCDYNYTYGIKPNYKRNIEMIRIIKPGESMEQKDSNRSTENKSLESNFQLVIGNFYHPQVFQINTLQIPN